MSERIVREVNDGVEFFTVLETGESGMSAAGIALLADARRQKVSRIVFDLSQGKGSEFLEHLRGQDLHLSQNAKKKGGIVNIIRAEYCADILIS